ncbi:non-ribosomal peptide synthetase [Lysobacter brunescens]|uniref:Amino acid adenylation domain-containing protein n=1 Tax=Lysobacter brunescens TaxID=262323 RepID=A0ABW2Y775_9GAMM
MFTKDMLSRMTPDQLRAMRRKSDEIPRQPRDGRALPASFAQQRLWFMAQGPSDAYPISRATELHGPLDRDALAWALGRLVARHESLRTRFEAVDGMPMQCIEDATCFAMAEDDLSALTGDAARAALAKLQHDEAAQGFDLGRAPLLRARLVRMAETRHVLLLTVHHIVFDGWSMAVFLRELDALYAARLRGEDDPLPPPALQYADYAVWQQSRIDDARMDASLAYWRETLRGAPVLLELPADRPRPPRQDFRGDWMPLRLDPALASDLKAFAQREGVTLYMLMMSAWAALLSRLSGQTDIVVGAPVAGRDRQELQDIVGFFVNMLAIRVQVEGDARTLAARMRHAILAAQDHQDAPFERVVEQVNPPRSVSHAPLFQTAFSWQGKVSDGLRLQGVHAVPLLQPHTVSKYDFMLSLGETTDGAVEGEIEYATALFDAATVRRFIGYFERLLRGMVATPEVALADLPMLDDAERTRQLRDWNRTQAAWTPGLLQDGFEAQARRTPDAVALAHGDATLTYADLDARANRLAHRLRALGIAPDARVGIAMPRGIDLVVAMLAVLKAGGAYVPLDPAYPPERLAGILDDAAPVAVLATGTGIDVLRRIAESHVAPLPPCIDPVADAAVLAALPSTAPARDDIGLSPAHLAYLIYTSGSTGKPKGVAIEHRQASNFIDWALRSFDGDELANVLFATSINFDLSIFECFVPLSAGGRATVVENALSLLDAAPPVTLINTVPSAIAELAAAGAIPPSVRTINLAGEALRRELGERLLALEHLHRLCNLYGPSETTTYSTWVSMRPQDGFATHIGGPVGNTRLYILDAQRRLLPAGAIGELYIGGAGVARGYLGRDDLSAERFLDDPFAAGDDTAPDGRTPRMYRTGDLARWRDDGTIEYLGRNDFQVKIRGFRVEPGEIETHLATCPGVREAVVVAREDAQGVRSLVAYCLVHAAADQDAFDAGVVRAALARVLPAHMVPSAFVALAQWPLTPNGKLDRGALPAPVLEAVSAADRALPETPQAQAMAAIWRDVLRVPEVGLHDDFFALGGHSLLGARLIARARSAFSVEMPHTALFSAPTIETLLALVEARLHDDSESARTQTRDAISRMTPEQFKAMRRRTNTIAPRARDGRDVPASFAQQRLWFLSGHSNGLDAYLLAQATELRGVLDRDALQWALDRIVERHEALRTRFEAVDGMPMQRFDLPPACPLAWRDLSALDPDAAQAALQDLQNEDMTTPFDLGRGPLLRGVLVRMAATRHVLLLTMHHIVSDGWSLGVFATELEALYAARLRGESDPLPPLPVQYADYAAWQRERLSGERLAREATFWREALQGAPALLELPTDRPRPAVQDHRGDWVEVCLDPALSASLKAFALRERSTLYMIVLAAWVATLSRLSGQDDLVVGTPVANRTRSEIQGLIGFFVNTLAIRIGVEGASSVATLLDRVKSAVLSAQDHQDLPFEQVVEQVNPVRSLSYSPLFQTVFAWQNNESGDLRLPGIEASHIKQPHAVSKFDLTLSLGEREDGAIAGLVEFATALFDVATVRRCFDCFERVLHAFIADTTQPVDRLPLLGDAQLREVTETFNATAHDFGSWRPVHACFEAHAASHPQAQALTCGDVELTYAELNARANRLAHWLRAQGAVAESLVAVCMQRSEFAIEAVLAVMKSGGAYVPVDPNYPQERVAEMLADAAPVLVLTDAASRADVEAALASVGVASRLVAVDADRAQWSDAASTDLPVEQTGVHVDSLAYVIYTSGSTGKPKGVASRHGGPSALMHALREPFGLDETTRVLQFASFSFDAFVLEWVMAYGFGGSLHLAGPEDSLLGEGLEAFVVKQRLTHCFLTPTLLSSLPETARLETMRLLSCGGEAVPSAVYRKWHTGRKFFNAYGPTETTALSIVQHCTPELAAGERLPIGRPLANERVYILDAHRQPVPVGVTGELYIGGAGVARGYLHRPELTAERFVDSPFVAGERLYRTGDLGRWRPDGLIEYLGRNDFQVKIRGYRIELGEIESRLSSQPGVKEAVVQAVPGADGLPRLVAYIEAVEGVEVDANALRAALQSQLPEYMVPTAYVAMTAWPSTRNGKLDRSALPLPEAASLGGGSEYVAPETPLEIELAAIWCEVLGVPAIGLRDDFFAFGGHSLLGVRLVARIRDRLGLELPQNALFATPTIERMIGSLAASLGLGGTGDDDRDMTPAREQLERLTPEQLRALRRRRQGIPLLPRGGRSLPASFAQQRLWFLSRMSGAIDAYHVPLVTELRGALDHDALRCALDCIVARHEALRTRFEAVDGAPCQRIDPPAPFALPLEDLSGLAADAIDAARDAAIRVEVEAPFDLEHGPLFRGRLLRLEATRHVLLLTMHHIVSDGWSIGVLTRELHALYAARLRGEDDPLPPLPVQYADYAAWQRERLSGERLAQEGAYWRDALRGAPALLELPADRPRPAEQDFRGASLPLRIEPALVARLKAMAGTRSMTLYMPLMAAWTLLMSRLSGQDDVVVGTPVANRGRSEIEGLIGFFVNMLAIRVPLDDAPDVQTLLERVRVAVLSAQDHQDLPFEQVVEQVNPARSLSYSPLFQSVFAWQNNEGGELALPGVAATMLDPVGMTAKYDLTLSLAERSDGAVSGSIEYATSLFDAATVSRFAGAFVRLLEGLAGDTTQPVDRLPLLGDAELREVTETFNATAHDFGSWRPVHACFEAHAASHPQAQALTCGDVELTYAELNARANRLAHWLRDEGVRTESLVAVCMQRSEFAIEAVLAVMKSGGAYVPVDPNYPQERVAEMLADAAPVLVLTDAASRADVEAALASVGVASRLVAVDADCDAWSSAASTDLPVEQTGVHVDSLAYVIYTSGSTGKPKGVASRHGGPSALMHALREPFGLDETTRVLQFASFSFDAFVLEWVMAYGFGGSLHLAGPEDSLLGEGLEAFVAKQRLTHCFLTPTLLSSLPETARLETMRLLSCGGEAVPSAVYRKWHTGRKFFNAYGPTETTALSIVQHCTPELAAGERLPIGRPLANEQVYILDAHRQPVPVGVIGELYIGGAGVARGYLHRPELTAERFVDSPFVAGERLYRTGDLGRWRPDGLIEYLGRNDFQVKIRGYRIELGEIESRLSSQPGVKEAVVQAVPGADGLPRLVAYIEAVEGVEVDANALRAALQSQLPEYMVPTAYVAMTAWPSTRNGKLDRSALPLPEAAALGGGSEYVAPETPMEEVLAGLWSELLGIERIGVHDRFFDLGGHSLMAMRLLAAVQDTFGFSLPLKTFFEAPTIADMARALLPEDEAAGVH